MVVLKQRMIIAAALICGAQLAAVDAKDAAPTPVIVAQLDGEPVYQNELDREIALAAPRLKMEGPLPAAVREKVLAQVIDRRLVLRYLVRDKWAVSNADIDLVVARQVKQLKQQEIAWAEHLKKQGLSEKQYRAELAWKLSWPKFLDQRLTDENLQKYFDQHRREFDGSELRVSHLLLKVPAGDAAALEMAQKQALEIRQQITTGKLSFADAAGKYSQSPTAKESGDIGWIQRHEPMPESFSQAAFALEKGAVSEPVVTAFGVHLIQAVELKPGKKFWQDCREELQTAVTLYLFRWIADKERLTAKIEPPPK